MGVKITVIGAGVSGLGSALAILARLPDAQITIVSETFSPNTTGDVAAGMWGPYLLGGTDMKDVLKWSKASWDKFLEWHKEDPGWGIRLVSGTCICDRHSSPEPWDHIPKEFRYLSQEECQQWGKQYVFGYAFTTICAEPSKFLPKMAEEVKRKGGTLRKQKVNSLSDVCSDADIVINCSGIGALSLVPDHYMTPGRGQVLRVKAPQVTTFFCDESEHTFVYIIPNTDSVILGGSYDLGDWNTQEDKSTTDQILKRSSQWIPSLKDAEVLSCGVGMRPIRTAGIRLEREDVDVDGKTVPVVHNYGHGGCGVTVMWGCALDVADIVANIVQKQ